jgi:hydroxymethylbilane synthase
MDLPEAARVGTSSLRRKCQLLSLRPDLTILDIRGNVGTRLRKLDDGKYDALVLAAAGIKRLGLEDRISQYIETQSLLPAVSQGALGIEIRRDDTAILELIEPLRHEASYLSVLAERALNRHLGGDCHVPIAAHAQAQGEQITMHALVGRLDGSLLIRSSGTGPVQQAELIGSRLGQELLDQGAGTILQELNQKHEG